MLIMMVHVQVKPDSVETFKTLVSENAAKSLQEPGVIRFDVLQETEDPSRFLIVEVYREEADLDKHRQTEHYRQWASYVGDLTVGERRKVFYQAVFPEPEAWK